VGLGKDLGQNAFFQIQLILIALFRFDMITLYNTGCFML